MEGQSSQIRMRRPRRLRRGEKLRELVADVRLGPGDLVLPLFVRKGKGVKREVGSMPGVYQMSPDVAVGRMKELSRDGLKAFILFGVTEKEEKDARGSTALNADNPVNMTLRMAREGGSTDVLMTDLCFCEYTDHGHCGLVDDDARVTVKNDGTVELLGQQAVVHAESGADVVAPSGMMDGQVGAIRRALDEAGHVNTAIMSYSVKYASSLYGPFREAGEGAPQFGDRRSYQMDYRRSREWETEVRLDEQEGADIVMVKPAGAYLDIVAKVRASTELPVAAYHVSGEYAMICAAAEKGWIDLKSAAVEITTGIKRAGADMILTYFGPRLLEWM